MQFVQDIHYIFILAAASLAIGTLRKTNNHWVVKVIISMQLIASLLLLFFSGYVLLAGSWIYTLSLLLLLAFNIKTLKNKTAYAVIIPMLLFNLFRVFHLPGTRHMAWLSIISLAAYFMIGRKWREATFETGLLAIVAADALVNLFMSLQQLPIFSS
ncbi:MAG: hypothetical protein GC193_06925 [Cryomorphaceae bacterium]|nr:hypothetical protein [Cryomorphaceae bacterium]